MSGRVSCCGRALSQGAYRLLFIQGETETDLGIQYGSLAAKVTRWGMDKRIRREYGIWSVVIVSNAKRDPRGTLKVTVSGVAFEQE